ncbi:hypothetical protein I7I53_09946 [Histoplasma capsulatum var. duboisii H88]|uniref:Uncharacterized protein n=1 Tax=Ajellomyces capsulatus (strain H88) TaxID=544711 RepID=A0A8A1LA48_AJEC8|nr:hypothetical protein I7I53_09946 [Histoplasma capsulatum var. duboisii H88]
MEIERAWLRIEKKSRRSEGAKANEVVKEAKSLCKWELKMCENRVNMKIQQITIFLNDVIQKRK